MLSQLSVAAFPHTPVLRLAEPEPYEVVMPISLAAAQAQKDREHREWVAEVFEKYRTLAYAYVFNHTDRDRHLADDIAQECFLRLIVMGKQIPHIRAWICTFCRYQIRNAYASRSKRKTRSHADFRCAHTPRKWIARGPSPDQIAEFHETQAEVRAFVAKCSPAEQRCFAAKLDGGATAGEARAEYGGAHQHSGQTFLHRLRDLRAKFADRQPKNKPYRMKVVGDYKPGSSYHRLHFDVYCIELDRKFDSVKEAAARMGINPSTLSHALAGRAPTAAGYRWEWRERKTRKEMSPALVAYFERKGRKHIG